MKKLHYLLLLVVVLFSAVSALAKTENGNDIALYFEEAKDNKKEFARLVDGTKGKRYFFRYLEIMNMKSGRKDGRPYVTIITIEPSSYFIVKFTVVKPYSLTMLMQDPISKNGTALALTGVISEVDRQSETITLNPVVLRHKDRSTPKRGTGTELLGEVDPTARYYSFTGAEGKPVVVSYGDRDILPWTAIEDPKKAAELKEEIQAQYTKAEWADYLTKLLEERKSGKKQAFKDAAMRAGVIRGSTNAPILAED